MVCSFDRHVNIRPGTLHRIPNFDEIDHMPQGLLFGCLKEAFEAVQVLLNGI